MKVIGAIGGAFLNISYVASTIAFHENTPLADTLVDSAGLFRQKGIMPGMSLTIAGSDSNDKTVTAATVTDSVITLIASDDLVDEAEGDAITLTSASSGAQILGLNNITVDDGIGIEDTTCFENHPYETHENTFKNWSATIGGFWLTEALKHEWLGKQLTFMIFIRTSASPSAGDPAVYYTGIGIPQGLSINMPAKELVKQSLNVMGNGQLGLIVKTDAW